MACTAQIGMVGLRGARRGAGSRAAVAGLTSRACWTNYALWSPLVHAPLPLKLLVVRQAYVWAVGALRALELLLRKGLVELESRTLEAGVRESVLDEGEDE